MSAAKNSATLDTALLAKLREHYEAGASVREIARISYRSYGGVHELLRRSGVTFRGRGGDHSKR